MLNQRACLIVSAAAATGAILGLLGRIELSVPAAILLLLLSRAAAFAATTEPPAARFGGSVAATIPAWILVASTAVLRANAPGLNEVRGANAVAGLALTHGEPVVVAACWLALLAGIVALAGSMPARRPSAGAPPAMQAELLSAAGLVLFLVCLFAGPQVVGVADLLPWVVGSLAVGAAAVLAATRIGPWSPRVATALAVLAMAGSVVTR